MLINYNLQDYSIRKLGERDISLPGDPVDCFILSDMSYVTYEDAPNNRYLLNGRNEELIVERVSQVVNAAKSRDMLLQD